MEKREKGFYIAELIFSYIIFGSIGIFVKGIPLPSSVIAAFRGIVGALFIFLYMLIARKKILRDEIKENALKLFISGFAIGFNWIFLFESYRYTSIATATLCYYMAPVFVVAAAPIFLKERLTLKSVICIVVALAGMFLVSGASLGSATDIYGILFALAAAVLYASVIICNKKMGKIAAETRALLQLFVAGITVLPYALITNDIGKVTLSTEAVILLFIIGIVHTGLAYAMTLGSVAKVEAGTVAVLSYIDPIVAILLEAVLINKALPTVTVTLGAILILGATSAASIKTRR